MSACVVALSLVSAASAQTGTALLVEVKAGDAVIASAEVTVAGATVQTDAKGFVWIPVTPGSIDVLVVKEGSAPASTTRPLAGPGGRRR